MGKKFNGTKYLAYVAVFLLRICNQWEMNCNFEKCLYLSMLLVNSTLMFNDRVETTQLAQKLIHSRTENWLNSLSVVEPIMLGNLADKITCK